MNYKRRLSFAWVLFLSCWFCNPLQAQKSGEATHFEQLGTPYGGCGVPESLVETSDYVALNVFNAPNTSATDPTRPLVNADTNLMGEFKNGRNCGRWVKVTMDDDCVGGSNSGSLGGGFCTSSGASWKPDLFNGSSLYMIVADACGDNNAWCRESPFHLDLHTPALSNFKKDNVLVGPMLPSNFNNRKITWDYISSPNYQGDIDIYFMKNSQQYWVSMLIGHLPNGIHNVEQKVGGVWKTLKMNGDMGQAYLLTDFTPPFTIRIYDADDKLIQDGRQYQFNNPCSTTKCTAITTKINYQKTDCKGVMGGTAFLDSCKICAGGTTGITPVVDKLNCITVGVSDFAKTDQPFNIYPNPAKNVAYLSLEGDWKLLSTNGIVLANGNGNKIPLKDWPKGLYIVSMNGKTTKLMKD
jgi:hypothetical protein